MTNKQLQTLRYICGYQAAHGRSPTYQEITNAGGNKNKSTAHRVIHALTERGYLRIGTGYRAIEVLRPVPVPRAPDGAALYAVPYAP